MKKIIIVCIGALIFFSCKKDINPAKSGELSFKPRWKEKMTSDNKICGSEEPVLGNGKVIFQKMFVGPEDVFTARDISDGNKIWSWDNPVDIPDGEYATSYKLVNGKLVVCSWHEFNLVDENSGNTTWRTDANDKNGCGDPRFAIFNNQIYHNRHECDDISPSSFLCRADLCCPKWDTLFSIRLNDNQGYRSSFESYAIYPKLDGDTLLLFQNRQINLSTLKDRIDLYALNLRTKKIEWKRDSIDADGNSSVRPILVDGDKAYFMGVVTLYCLNAKTGQTIWQKRFNQDYPYDQLNETLLFTTLVIVDGKLIVKPTDKHMYALDPNTGSEIWALSDAASSPESMSVYKDLVMFPSSGKEGVFAYRVSDGKLMGRLQSPHKADGGQIVTGIAVDEKEGLLFCTDGLYGMCFKIEY